MIEKSNTISREMGLLQVLESTNGEAEILRWLKKNPTIIQHSVPFGHYVVAEFPLGTEYRSDFVVMAPFSGGWDIHFVELEPPDEKLFTRMGNPASRLATAVTQLTSWKIFFIKNHDMVLRDLSRFAKKKELIWGVTERNL
jgi:antiviral defense system Shedu protein SduA